MLNSQVRVNIFFLCLVVFAQIPFLVGAQEGPSKTSAGKGPKVPREISQKQGAQEERDLTEKQKLLTIGQKDPEISSTSFPDWKTFKMKLLFGNIKPSVEIESIETENDLVFEPRLQPIVGVELALGAYSLGYSFYLPEDEEDDEVVGRGPSQVKEFRLRYNLGHHSVALIHSQVSGFTLINSDKVVLGRKDGDPLIYDASMNSVVTGLNWTYVLNPKAYSFSMIFDQAEIQKERGGSWLLGTVLKRSRVKSKNSIIPKDIQNEFGKDATLKNTEFWGVLGKGGYGYNLIFLKNWYFGGAFLLGVGPQWGHYQGAGGFDRAETNFALQGEFQFSTGYVGKKFFSGLTGELEATQYRTQRFAVSTSNSMFHFYIGGFPF